MIRSDSHPLTYNDIREMSKDAGATTPVSGDTKSFVDITKAVIAMIVPKKTGHIIGE